MFNVHTYIQHSRFLHRFLRRFIDNLNGSIGATWVSLEGLSILCHTHDVSAQLCRGSGEAKPSHLVVTLQPMVLYEAHKGGLVIFF